MLNIKKLNFVIFQFWTVKKGTCPIGMQIICEIPGYSDRSNLNWKSHINLDVTTVSETAVMLAKL